MSSYEFVYRIESKYFRVKSFVHLCKSGLENATTGIKYFTGALETKT